MPSQLEPALEERFGDLLDQLRATHVEPSRELRERVELMGRLEPRSRRPLFRRRVLALAFAAALGVGTVAVGIAQRGGGAEESAPGAVTVQAAQGGGGATDKSTRELAPTAQAARLQDFHADLTVRVDDPDELPDATQQAMKIAQSLGGYVVSAQYGGGDTDSVMTLSVPIANAEEAITRLTSLGELAAQQYSLQDLQSTVDQLDAQADRLREHIAELEAELKNPRLGPRERANIRAELEQTQRELDAVTAQRDGTAAQGRMAEITLTLTANRVAPSTSDGVIHRAIDSLKSVWEWVLAVLIVALPFLLLLAAAYWVGRRLRRRANERLLGG
jgi:uncharacterized protein DUF4349